MNMPRSALLAAYMVAMGLVCWSDIKAHQAPQPRRIVMGSLVYGLLGVAAPVISDPVAAALGWGVLAAMAMRGTGGGATAGGGGGIGGLLSPNPGQAPNASVPDPGVPPATPPYAWDLVPRGTRLYQRNGVTVRI